MTKLEDQNRNQKSTPIVLKVRKRKRPALRLTRTTRKGLPSASLTHLKAPSVPLPRLNHGESSPRGRAAAPSVNDHDEDVDFVFDNLPNDTMLAIQSLAASADTSISIPLNSIPDHPCIHAVLESMVYKKVEGGVDYDTTVSREIQELTNSNQLRYLSTAFRPNDGHSMSLLVCTNDFIRAVEDARIQHDGNAETISWFIRHIGDWTRLRIAASDMEVSYATDPISQNFDQVVVELVRNKVLLANHQNNSYQLWLPSWGLVLAAWENARKKLRLQLQSSSYKERSVLSIRQPYSPISTNVLIEWMVCQSEIEKIERPAGDFIRLNKQES